MRVLALGSGGNLTELASFYAYNPAFISGVSVACGDVDGDGVAEIITGAGPGGGPHVRVLSLGGGGALIEWASFYAYNPAFTGGVYVAVGDLDGDGIAEIITGAGPFGGPHVRVFSVGAGGALTERVSFYAYDPAFRGGVHVAAGDMDGDGTLEIVTGAGEGGGPNVRVIRVHGTTLIEVASFYAYDPAFTGGVTVASAAPAGEPVIGSDWRRFVYADNASGWIAGLRHMRPVATTSAPDRIERHATATDLRCAAARGPPAEPDSDGKEAMRLIPI